MGTVFVCVATGRRRQVAPCLRTTLVIDFVDMYVPVAVQCRQVRAEVKHGMVGSRDGGANFRGRGPRRTTDEAADNVHGTVEDSAAKVGQRRGK